MLAWSHGKRCNKCPSPHVIYPTKFTINHMKDRQKVRSLFFPREAYEPGSIDVTEKFFAEVPAEEVEAIKYVTTDATEAGIYFTVVYLAKEEKKKGVMGFTN